MKLMSLLLSGIMVTLLLSGGCQEKSREKIVPAENEEIVTVDEPELRSVFDDSSIENLTQRFAEVEQKLEALKKEFGQQQNRLQALEAKLQQREVELREREKQLENEIARLGRMSYLSYFLIILAVFFMVAAGILWFRQRRKQNPWIAPNLPPVVEEEEIATTQDNPEENDSSEKPSPAVNKD